MFDIRAIRDNPDAFRAAFERKQKGLGEVVSHEFDRTGGTRIKFYYGIRFLLQHRQRPTTLTTMDSPPSSVVVEDIPRADIESAASGIPRTTQSSSATPAAGSVLKSMLIGSDILLCLASSVLLDILFRTWSVASAVTT